MHTDTHTHSHTHAIPHSVLECALHVADARGDADSLYTKAVVSGYQRGLRRQTPTTSVLKVEGVENHKQARWYAGKRVAFVYKAKNARLNRVTKKMTHYRVLWGKITRPHGNSGCVRAQFKTNLPAKAMGATVRVVRVPLFFDPVSQRVRSPSVRCRCSTRRTSNSSRPCPLSIAQQS
jgi:large subunit ribosomal protein L35Ae